MDIGFDQNEWRAAPASRALEGGWGQAPEWLALHARLSAAWCARRELAAQASDVPSRCGSFDRGSATSLASLEHASLAVNPFALVNLKPGEGNAGHHAGDSTPGGRG